MHRCVDPFHKSMAWLAALAVLVAMAAGQPMMLGPESGPLMETAELADTPRFSYRVVKEYSHRVDAWTEGLSFVNGKIYESTVLECCALSHESLSRSCLFAQSLSRLPFRAFLLLIVTYRSRCLVCRTLVAASASRHPTATLAAGSRLQAGNCAYRWRRSGGD